MVQFLFEFCVKYLNPAPYFHILAQHIEFFFQMFEFWDTYLIFGANISNHGEGGVERVRRPPGGFGIEVGEKYSTRPLDFSE